MNKISEHNEEHLLKFIKSLKKARFKIDRIGGCHASDSIRLQADIKIAEIFQYLRANTESQLWEKIKDAR